ncbi:tetratricopeptide repeat protein [Thermodesulfobacteriota bacterium]
MTSKKYQEYRDLLKKRHYAEASRLAELEYLGDDKNNPFWLARQAAALSRAKKFEKSLEIAKQALALEPSNPYSILSVAEALFGLNRFAEAVDYYEEIYREPKLSSFSQKGILDCCAKMKQWDRILELIEIWKMPPDMRLRWEVKALAAQNRVTEAIRSCRKWLEMKPDYPEALWAMTDLEVRRDGIETVLSRWRRLAKIPSRPSIYNEIYASLCRKSGKNELALKEYDKISQTGSKTYIQRQQVFTLAKSGRETKAVSMAEELLKLNPKDIYVHSSYMGACRRLGQMDRALRFYETLIDMHPEEKSIYGRIRKIKKMLGLEA